MRFKLFFCLYVALTFFIGISNTYSATYFVATDGNDSNAGNYANPWKTFQNALNIVGPSDTLFIRQGNYTENLITVNSGTNATDSMIIISAFENEKVILKGDNYQNTGIQIRNQFIKIEGIEDSHWSEGMAVAYPAAYITVSNCKFHDMNFGVSVYHGTHNLTFINCEMYNFGHFGFDATASGDSLENEISDVTLVNCFSHDADFTTPNHNPDGNADGFAFGHSFEKNIMLINCTASRTGDGFDLDGINVTALNCTAKNTSYQSGGGFKCWADTVNLINCLSYNNYNTGIELDEDLANVQKNKNQITNIFNCTSVDNGYYNLVIEGTTKNLNLYNSLIVGGIQYNDSTLPRGMVFYLNGHGQYTGDYNIFHSITDDSYIIDVRENEVDYNSDSLVAWQAATGMDTHSMFLKSIDSVFSNRQNGNFHLKKNSPAINKGSSAFSYPTDKDKINRDSLPDIGCYEYSSETGIQENIINSPDFVFAFYPNPAENTLNIYLYSFVSEKFSISIYDIGGNLVKDGLNYHNSVNVLNNVTMDCSSLQSGTYFIVLNYGPNSYKSKFIVRK